MTFDASKPVDSAHRDAAVPLHEVTVDDSRYLRQCRELYDIKSGSTEETLWNCYACLRGHGGAEAYFASERYFSRLAGLAVAWNVDAVERPQKGGEFAARVGGWLNPDGSVITAKQLCGIISRHARKLIYVPKPFRHFPRPDPAKPIEEQIEYLLSGFLGHNYEPEEAAE